MMSTILLTSFLTFSGREAGRSLFVSLRLHRYMASANSGKSSCPDFVVSDSSHIRARLFPSSLLLSSRSLALSPLNACSLPVALLNNCSNFDWSVAVMKDRRMLGIFLLLDEAGAEDGAGCAGDERKELAMSALLRPVG